MKRILAITLAFSVFANIALAAEVVRPEPKPVTNLHDSQGIHEDLIASQELIALGCMGKLNIAPTASGSYDSASLAKIQECADNEGTDLAAKILDSNLPVAIAPIRGLSAAFHVAGHRPQMHGRLAI